MHRIKDRALFLIDGSYLLYRSYYGLRPLQTASGIPTQATYGFCRAIKKMIDDFDPKNVVLVWDSKGKTKRKEIYEEYKANRQKPPSDLFLQKEQIMEFADSIELHQVSKTGYEADDLIGSIVQDYKGEQVVIVGPDKDLYQLISDKVLIFDPFKDRIIDNETLKKEKGFGAGKVAFFYSLVGDASDNIPGVRGIGKKTAQGLVNNFDSVKNLYANLDKVEKDRTRRLLQESRENAFLSFQLFSLEYYKIKLTKKDCEFNKNNLIKAADFFRKLEFTSLLRDLVKVFGKASLDKERIKKEINGSEQQLSMFETDDEMIKQLHKVNKWKCHLVRKEKDLDVLVAYLQKSKEFAFDTETTGFKPLRDELVGISFAMNKKEAYYIPVGHVVEKKEDQLDLDLVIKKLKPIFENKKIKKLLQNAKFDQLVLSKQGIEVEGVSFDTLIAAHLLKQNDGEKINLKVLSARLLGERMDTFKEVLGKHKTFAQVPIANGAEYGAHDSLQTLKLKDILQKDLNKNKTLKKVFTDLEMPLSFILYEMEKFGIKLDIKRLEEIGKEIDKDINKIKSKIDAAISHHYKGKKEINLNSPAQVEFFLFKDLKLPVIKKTSKGKPSTDQEVLLKLSEIHPIPGMIATYREYTKLQSTYVQSLIKQVNPKTGRIHTSFSQTMTATGRLSSSKPNLQNIPTASDHGIKIRSAFVAPSNKVFLSADYSQIELRVLAHLTKDKNLISAYKKNEDVHALTASQVFNVALDKVTHKQRQMGKRINFGIMYGLTPYGLSKDIGIKPAEAKEYMDKYFEKYKGVFEWLSKTIEQAKKDGYVQTLFGRKRYVPGIAEKNRILFDAATRIVKNTPIQGTAAEIMKMAMIDLQRELDKSDLHAKMILQIHDELILEVPKDEQERAQKMVKKCMERVVMWEIPLNVTLRAGKSWKQVTK